MAENQDYDQQKRSLARDITKSLKDDLKGLIDTAKGYGSSFSPEGLLTRLENNLSSLGPGGSFVKMFTTERIRAAQENKKLLEKLEKNRSTQEEASQKKQTENIGEITNLLKSQMLTNEILLKAFNFDQNNFKSERERIDEEERESDKQHEELIDAINDLKITSAKDIGDDRGFFAGLGNIASVLGGIALGLSEPGVFRMSQVTKAVENFKVKFPKITDDIKNFFKADNFPRFDDAVKTFKADIETIKTNITTKFDGFKTKTKKFFDFEIPKLPEIPKVPEGVIAKFNTFKLGALEFFDIDPPKLPEIPKVPEGVIAKFDGFKTKTKKFFDIDPPKLPDVPKVSVDAPAKLKSYTSTLDNFFDVGKQADEVTTAVKAAVETTETASLASKAGKLAKSLTTGFAGRVLSIAGNPVFDVIAQGKDIFDIANAVTDDDVRTAVKKEDIGAVVGGFIGAAIGVIGGPAGMALGLGLGNMAGEFIGQAMDDPEIIGAIEKVKSDLKGEKDTLIAEISDIEAKLKDKSISSEMKALLEEQLKTQTARVVAIDEEMKAFAEDGDIAKKQKELEAIGKRGDELAKEKASLEEKIALAEEKGDTQRVAYLNKILEQTEKEFSDAETKYQNKSEELRLIAQKTSGRLAEASTNFFDRIATEGGFFGTIFSAFGAGVEGQEGTNLLDNKIAELQSEIEMHKKELEGGDSYTAFGTFRGTVIKELERDIQTLENRKKKLSEKAPGLARGGIVTKPAYLPNSGIVVGESATYSGRSAARGAVTDGPTEAIIPLERPEAVTAISRPIAGAILNQMQMERATTQQSQSAPMPIVMDNSTQVVNNNTTVVPPMPQGPRLPGSGRDQAFSHFRHTA